MQCSPGPQPCPPWVGYTSMHPIHPSVHACMQGASHIRPVQVWCWPAYKLVMLLWYNVKRHTARQLLVLTTLSLLVQQQQMHPQRVCSKERELTAGHAPLKCTQHMPRPHTGHVHTFTFPAKNMNLQPLPPGMNSK